MAINERLIHTAAEAAAGASGAEQNLILHLDANDVDSYDGDGSVWYDITNHEYTPAVDPAENFNTVLYSHNSGSAQSITGVGFQPDLVWIKDRNQAEPHQLIDSVRGAGKVVESDDNSAETTRSDGLTSFDSDGFSLGVDSAGVVNYNGRGPYVAWCFKAGGAPTASTPYMVDGTGYSTLAASPFADDGDLTLHEASINTKLGFGIYRFNPSVVSGETNSFDHGLGATPELIITKSVSDTYNWWTWTNQIDGSWDYLKLNASDAKANDTITSGAFADATTMRFAYGFTGTSSDHVAYAFTSKRGVSKVGSYTGSTGSVTVNTGFKPAFVMIKNTGIAGDPWVIFDNKRGDNGEYDYLYPNENYAEGPGDSTLNSGRTGITFNADGFTLDDDDSHSVNESGKKFIYLAIAEKNPSSLIDDTNLGVHLDAGNTDSYDPSSDGSTWSDLTASNADVTLTSMNASQHDKEIGGWFSFDGSGDYGTVSNDNVRVTTGGALTVEMWIRPAAISSVTNRYLLGQNSTTNGSYSYTVDQTNQTLRLLTYSHSGGFAYAVQLTTGNVLTQANKWYHFAFTLSDTVSENVIYINGENVKQATSNGIGTERGSSNQLQIAAINGGSQWQGDIGQVRIYQDTLTADEIMQNYRFTKNDYTNGYNGTITGATWDSGSGETPEIPYFTFDGSGDKIVTTLDLSGTSIGGFSISTWFRMDTTNTYNAIFGDSNIVMWIGGGNMTGSYTNESLYLYQSSPVMETLGREGEGEYADDNWHQLIITCDGTATTDKKFYVDGVAQTMQYKSGQSENWTFTNLQFGQAFGGTYNYNGDISEVKVFDKALSSSEVVTEFNLRCEDFGLTQI